MYGRLAGALGRAGENRVLGSCLAIVRKSRICSMDVRFARKPSSCEIGFPENARPGRCGHLRERRPPLFLLVATMSRFPNFLCQRLTKTSDFHDIDETAI